MNSGPEGDWPAVDRGTPAWIRAVADGEIAEPSDLSGDEARAIAFERSLRERTASVLSAAGTVSTPDSLRARVLAAVEQDRADAGAVESVPERLSARTSDRSFWSSPARWVPAAAAAAVLLVGGFYVTSSLNTAPGVVDPGFDLTRAGFSTEMARYITGRHQNACERTANAVADLSFSNETTAIADVSEILGRSLCIDRMPGTLGCPAPIEYRGGDLADVPGSEKSLHLLMRLDGEGDSETNTASLFVMRAPDGVELDPSLTYEMDASTYGCRGYRVAVWASEGVVYTLVVNDAAETVMNTVLAAMYRPAPSESL